MVLKIPEPKENSLSIQVVLFEDHTLINFRPLTWTLPTYEMRLGVFNARERVELATSNISESGFEGILLCRENLAPLHTCHNWKINPGFLPKSDSPSGMVLWLNGRNCSSIEALIEKLKGLTQAEESILVDKSGLVGALLTRDNSAALWKSWEAWNFSTSGENHEVGPWHGYQALGLIPTDSTRIPALEYIWDIVPETAAAITGDVDFLTRGPEFIRTPFGIVPDPDQTAPFWQKPNQLVEASSHPELARSLPNEGQGIWLGDGVDLAPGAVLDTSLGPVLLDRGVKVMPHCYLQGPLYVGQGSLIKAGATIYGESSFGIGNRLAGEIGESTFSDFANKQHAGFIGHAVLGSWTNLGALTTCSDLKNNYGNVRVDLGFGTIDTGRRFVGLLLGDHVKTAIGTLFNTGTSVGFASNVFGGVMPPKYVGNYSWGGQSGSPIYQVEKAISTASVVLGRRGCILTEANKKLMHDLA